jgi:hypothetical protein
MHYQCKKTKNQNFWSNYHEKLVNADKKRLQFAVHIKPENLKHGEQCCCPPSNITQIVDTTRPTGVNNDAQFATKPYEPMQIDSNKRLLTNDARNNFSFV